MKKLKNLALVLCLMLSVFVLTACGSNTTLVLSTEDGILTAKPGASIQFSTEIKSKNKDEQSKSVTYSIVSGETYGTISATGLLTINSNATPNSKIKVVSQLGEVKSNEVEIVVASVPVTGITLTSNKTSVKKSGYVTLTVNTTPADTTDTFNWVFVEGETNCDGIIATNVANEYKLMVKDTATTGATIKVKAQSGNISSNVITLNIAADAQENMYLSFVNEEITLDSKDDNQTQKLEVVLRNGEGQKVTNKTITFAIEEGSDLIDITPNGYTCNITIKGHGTAKVSASVEGTSIEEVAVVNVKVPPVAINLPKVFTDRMDHKYNVAVSNTGIPFAVSVSGEKVCTQYSVKFYNSNNVEDNTLASYEDNEITFKKTGLVTVKFTSLSGSKRETQTSYTFDVNDGINVFTYEELKNTIANTSNAGKKINIIALNESDNYNLIPAICKLDKNNQDITQVRSYGIYTQKSLFIYGNRHGIDISNLSTIPGSTDYNSSSIIDVEPLPGTSVYVDIHDLNLKGNCGINDDINIRQDGRPQSGIVYRALYIGREGKNVTSATAQKVYANITNVNIEHSFVGMRISRCVNSMVENVTVNDIYSNGVESSANTITFKNMTFGLCGAAGIEITPDESNTAGENLDQHQRISFAGYIKSQNKNKGDTKYLTAYMGGIVAPVIKGNLGSESGYNETQLSNVVDSNESLIFVTFIFNNVSEAKPNYSEVDYSNADDAGIINLEDTSKTEVDTTHQFIRVKILIPEAVAKALGSEALTGQTLGYILVYNHNYIPTK
ncbi:MAG TPA: hypothetical protein DD621_01275 [Clostridiales bacterium]|nr:hypothetical protein [Clostridiales bacterium]